MVEPRGMVPEDLYRIVWIEDAQISRDGRRIAFVRRWMEARRDEYRSEIWLVDADHRIMQPESGLTSVRVLGAPAQAGMYVSRNRFAPGQTSQTGMPLLTLTATVQTYTSDTSAGPGSEPGPTSGTG